jgi:cell division septal protein FtsQ
MNVDTPVPSQAAPPHALRAAPVTRPSRTSRLLRGVARFVSGSAIAVAGVLGAGVGQVLTEPWLSPDARLSFGAGVCVAIWFTAGRSWLRPSRWQRLAVVFGLSFVAGALLCLATLRSLRSLGISI